MWGRQRNRVRAGQSIGAQDCFAQLQELERSVLLTLLQALVIGEVGTGSSVPVYEKRRVRNRHGHRKAQLRPDAAPQCPDVRQCYAQRQRFYRRPVIRLDGNRAGNKRLRSGVRVGMRNHRHPAVAGIEPHDVIAAVVETRVRKNTGVCPAASVPTEGKRVHDLPSVVRESIQRDPVEPTAGAAPWLVRR